MTQKFGVHFLKEVPTLNFEGSEKKVEVVVSGVNLRSLGPEFWAGVVKASKAQILSKISSSQCDLYLLSESSLFVWDHRFTMITCGETTLASAVAHCLDQLGKDSVEFLTYERKNEYFPEKQKTHFFDDVKLLETYISGDTYCFGEEEAHHLYLFHSNKPYSPPPEDVTLEILMYGLQGEARKIFNQPLCSTQQIQKALEFSEVLPGFIIDDHVFDPCGYSLNAVKGRDYYTVHVTPQDSSSYVSFETNTKIDQNYSPVLKKIVDIFKPKSFDVVIFRACAQEFIDVPGFDLKEATKVNLSCGYTVNHCHFKQSNGEALRSLNIKNSKTAKQL